MRPIPIKLRNDISADPYYSRCARANEFCEGRITWEHAFIYAGRQVNEKWAIIPLCVFHHLGPGLDKDLNHFIALRRANIKDLEIRMPKRNWAQEFAYLQAKFKRRAN